MLDIKFIRENPEKIKQNILNRNVDTKKADIDKLLLLDVRKTKLEQEIEKMRALRNDLADRLKDVVQRTPENVKDGKKLKEGIEVLEKELDEVKDKWQQVMDWIPNILSSDVPLGKSEDNNLEIKAWTPQDGYFKKDKLGLKDFSKKWMPSHNFNGKDHLEIGKLLDIIDIDQSAKTSGSRFAYLKNDLVIMQYALFDLLFKKLITSFGFHPMIVPQLVKERVLYGTSHFPEGRDQVYKIENTNVEDRQDLYLVGSSEPPLFAYGMDRVFDQKDLPYKMCAYTSCFRSEVGSWGKDVRGLKRVHQFDKLEIDVICTPEQGNAIFEELLEINSWFLQELKLPYHQILKCTGDSGYSASHKQVDTETWLPTTQEFLEVGTDTHATDFQARRLNIKYQDSKGDKNYIYTINDTGCPMGRILISILDNYQNPDGSVNVPNALQAYMGKKIINLGQK
jgi:seryl-tRNA synthetase